MNKKFLLKHAKPMVLNKLTANLLPKKTMTRKVAFGPNEKTNFSKYKIGDILWIREPTKIKKANFKNTRPEAIIEYTNGAVKSFYLPNRYEKVPNWFSEGKSVPNGCLKEMARYIIKITDVRTEELQSISAQDIYKEGYDENRFKEDPFEWFENLWNRTARKGYKWENNPYVFVYEWKYLYKEE